MTTRSPSVTTSSAPAAPARCALPPATGCRGRPGAAAAAAAVRGHWPEYLIEGWALGMFMISAGVFTTLLEYPGSPVHVLVPDPVLRRVLIGVAMGLTAIALIYSPWGQRSGAHMNPAVTLGFLRLGKIRGWDAAFFISAQFFGGTLGVLTVTAVLREAFAAPPVRYVATLPGSGGAGIAFAAELVISALMMATVLTVSNSVRWARLTGVCAGILVAIWISLEAPLSGMSMNPARSFASALPGGLWASLWVYLTAPVLGMQLGAGAYVALRGRAAAGCAKLLHPADQRCIHCGYEPPRAGAAAAAHVTTTED
ncbi:MAG: aquaporin [Gammaproteobacteria bacterium]|nr:aquaporin [Gammaproteobacteria bacterium]